MEIILTIRVHGTKRLRTTVLRGLTLKNYYAKLKK